MSYQGFPPLGKQLKIINKLNRMALTLSQGAYQTKSDRVISQLAHFPERQTFKVTERNFPKLFYIQVPDKNLVLSILSSWGDLVYSQVKFEKYNQQTTQMWRIVAYDEVMYNEKNQQKHVFQYQPQTTSPNSLGLGYQYLPYNVLSNNQQQTQQTQVANQISQPAYKIGYQFQSGLHIDAAKKSQTENTVNLNVQQTNNNIAYPTRFPIKQRNNLPPMDRDNKGWFFIENVKSNLVLQIEAGIDQRGMSIVLNKLYGNRNQLWRFQ